MVSVSSSHKFPAKLIQKAQRSYKALHDWKARSGYLQVGDRVPVKFPHDETGRDKDVLLTVVLWSLPSSCTLGPCVVSRVTFGYYWCGTEDMV